MAEKKIAVTGTHGTGKSVFCLELMRDLKIKHPKKSIVLLQELARECPFPINKNQTIETAIWLFTSQIRKELLLEKNYDIVICDRSIMDCLAYTIANGIDVDFLLPFAFRHVQSYDKLYLRIICEENDYLQDDGVRDVDLKHREKVQDILSGLYGEAGVRNKIYFE